MTTRTNVVAERTSQPVHLMRGAFLGRVMAAGQFQTHSSFPRSLSCEKWRPRKPVECRWAASREQNVCVHVGLQPFSGRCYHTASATARLPTLPVMSGIVSLHLPAPILHSAPLTVVPCSGVDMVRHQPNA